MDEWSSGASRDVHDTLAEMDRRLSELQRDLAGVSSRSAAPGGRAPSPPPPPPPPPSPAREDLRGVEERLTRIAEEARLQADALARRIDDLTGLRDELERSASQLADAAERARAAQRLPSGEPPLPPPADETAEPAPFTTDPTPPSWLASESIPPLEPAMPPTAEEPLGDEPEQASIVDEGLADPGFADPGLADEGLDDAKAPSVEEPAADLPGHVVSLDAGPFADIVALSAFEEMLDRLPGVTEVYVRGLEGNRAHIDVRTTSERSLVEDLRDGIPLAFSVTREDADAVTLNVEGIAPR